MKKILLSGIGLVFGLSSFAQVTTTFNYTGAVQTYTVPCGVTTVTIESSGAQGGTAAIGGTGGLGGYATGVLSVTPGNVLYIYVGGQNGYNGGGTGGQTGNSESQPANTLAPNGGGASDVRLNGTALTDRVIVAGGGGAGASNGVWGGCQVAGPAGNGGAGGGLTGSNGTFGVGAPCNCGGGGGDGGQGGTQAAGGAAGMYAGSTACLRPSWSVGNPGTLGFGGSGALTYHNGSGGGGGGGGGYYGGGAGGNGSDTTPGGGGGGGSSFLGTLTSASTTPGTRSGDGVVLITAASSSTVPAAPATISGNSSVCVGSSASYSISAVATANSYTWTVPAGSTITSGQGTTAITITAGSTSGNITVTADNCNGSSAPATFTLTVNALPAVAITPPAPAICNGSNITLNASGAATYVWSSVGTAATEVVSPATQTSYTVTGTDANGCVNTASVTVNVNALPVVSATATAGTICAGTNDTLNATGAATYAWSSGGTAATEVVSPATSSSYTVTGTDANGCTATATVSVTVNAAPDVAATASPVEICAGSSDTLTATGAATYVWSTGGTAATELVTPASTETYTVTGTDNNGCTASATVSVTVHSNPIVTGSSTANTVCLSDANVTLTGAPAGGTWSGPGVTGSSFNPSTAGTGAQSVSYLYTDANGCSAAAGIVITVNGCVGINETQTVSGVNVFPNPNNGNLIIRSNADVKEMLIVVTDISGRVVFTTVVKNVTAGIDNRISLEGVAAGMYTLSVSSEKFATTERISVQK